MKKYQLSHRKRRFFAFAMACIIAAMAFNPMGNYYLEIEANDGTNCDLDGVTITLTEENVTVNAVQQSIGDGENHTIYWLKGAATATPSDGFSAYISANEMTDEQLESASFNVNPIDITASFTGYIYVKDSDGQIALAEIQYDNSIGELRFSVDDPTGTALSDSEGAYGNKWYDTTPSVQLEVNDSDAAGSPVTILYRIYKVGTTEDSRGDFENYNCAINVPDGKQVLEYYAKDTAGNSTSVFVKTFYVDTSTAGLRVAATVSGEGEDDQPYTSGDYTNADVTVFVEDKDGTALDLATQNGWKIYFLESEEEVLADSVDWGQPAEQNSKVFSNDGYNKYCHVKVENTVTGREFVDKVQIRIDKTAPEAVSLKLTNQDGSTATTDILNGEMWYKSGIKFVLEKANADKDDDTVSIQYRWYQEGIKEENIGDFEEYSSSDTGVNLNDGKWILQYYAIDEAGNKSSEEPVEKKIYVDESNVYAEPEIEAKTEDGSVYVGGSASNQDVTLSIKSEGVQIVPDENRIGMFYYSSSMSLDETALNQVEDSEWSSVDATGKIKIHVDDNGNLNRYYYVKVDKLVTGQSWIKSIHVRIDKETPDIENVCVTTDIAPGTQLVDGTSDCYWYDDKPALTVSLPETGSTLYYKLYEYYKSSDPEPESYTISNSDVEETLGDGRWILKYKVKDEAGNFSEETTNYYYVDSQLTSLTIKTILADGESDYTGGYSNQNINFSAISSDGTVYKTDDNIEVYYDLGDGSWSLLNNDTGMKEITIAENEPMFDQVCSIKVVNTDTGRVIISDPVQIEIDTEAPEVAPILKVSSEPDGAEITGENIYGGKWYQDSIPTLSFEDLQQDGGSDLHIEYRLYKEGETSGEFITYDSSGDRPVLGSAGKWVLEYKTVDEAENESNTSCTKFYIDKKPSLEISVKDAANQTYVEGENTEKITFTIENTTEGIGTKYFVYESTEKCTDDVLNGAAWTQINGDVYAIDESKLKNGEHYKKYIYIKAVSTGDTGMTDVKEQYIFVDRKNPANAGVSVTGDSKAQGWYYTLPQITMTSPVDDGTQITTYYKLYKISDGEPEYSVLNAQNQPKISGDGQYILKYYTKDAAGNKSEEKNQTINYDSTLPTQPKIVFTTENSSLLAKVINYVSFNYFCKERIAVSVSSEDVTSGVVSLTYYTEENGVKGEEKTISGSAGTFYLDPGFKGKVYVSAKDGAGNVTTYSISDGVVYDNINAEITISSQDNEQWISGDIALDIVAQDKESGLKKITCVINDKTVYEKDFLNETDVIYMDQFRVTATDEALSAAGYKILVTVEDNAGNVYAKEKLVYVDKTAPVIQLSGIEEGSYLNRTASLNATVKDQIYEYASTSLHVKKTLDGVTNEYEIPGAALSAIESTGSYEFDQDGSYEVTVNAVDAAGNKAEAQVIHFVVDKTAPVIEITGPSEGSYSMSDVETSIKVTESFYDTDEVTIKVTKELDGTVSDYPLKGWRNTGKDSVLKSSFTEDGTYKIQIEAMDAAGNKATIKTLQFTVDKTAPVLSISGAEDYQISSHEIVLQYNVTESYYDTDNVEVSLIKEDIDGNKSEVNVGNWVNRAKESSLTYQITSDGIYTARIVATDKAGNKAEVQKTVTVDTNDPVIRYIDEINGKYFQTFVLPYDINDMIQDLTVPSYELYLNSEEYDGVTEVTEEGKYVLKVETEDEAGHSANAKAEFIVDHTAPDILIVGVENAKTYYEAVSPVISLAGSEDSIEEILLDDVKQDFDSETMQYENTISSIGRHEILVTAVDYAGNTTEQLISFEIKNKSVFRKWYENTPLFVASIIIVLGGGAGGVAFFGIKRKKTSGKKM
ncbi:MAG: Ig-like domain-containing protein [Roseburia sp.]